MSRYGSDPTVYELPGSDEGQAEVIEHSDKQLDRGVADGVQAARLEGTNNGGSRRQRTLTAIVGVPARRRWATIWFSEAVQSDHHPVLRDNPTEGHALRLSVHENRCCQHLDPNAFRIERLQKRIAAGGEYIERASEHTIP
jgi:hypothetical protein